MGLQYYKVRVLDKRAMNSIEGWEEVSIVVSREIEMNIIENYNYNYNSNYSKP